MYFNKMFFFFQKKNEGGGMCISFASNNVLNIFFREDIEDVDDVVAAEETPERQPISKIGKSKSEEVDMPGDRSTTGTTGERAKLDILQQHLH